MHGIMDNYHLHELSVKISAYGLGYNMTAWVFQVLTPLSFNISTTNNIIELAMGQDASVTG